MKMTNAIPIPRQMSTSATEYSASPGSPSQSGGCDAPRNRSAVLMSPADGCMSAVKVTPTATVLTSVGKNTMLRMTPRSRIASEVRSIAKGSAMITLEPLVSVAYTTVLRRLERSAWSPRNVS